jgi:small subunit ribosomal protein S11
VVKDKKTGKKSKSKSRKNIHSGIVSVKATFNNTIITIADLDGNTLVQGGPSKVGFKGSKKSTAFAATKAAKEAGLEAIKKYGLREVKAYLCGAGAGRNAAVKGLDSAGLRITSLVDKTGIPHNGCTPRKKPRK